MTDHAAPTAALLCLATALLLAQGSAQAETDLGLALRGESADLNDDSLFATPPPYRRVPRRTTSEELFVRYARRGAVFEWVGTHREQDGNASTQGRLNELYLDVGSDDLDFTVGKKVMSFGVGYGFRPLDVIQREARRPLFRERLEGVPVAVVEKLDGDSSLSAIYVNRMTIDSAGVRRGTHEAVLRHYRFWGSMESHALLHLDEELGASPGAGFTWVYGDHLELHGSFLYQSRYRVPMHDLIGSDTLLATSDPWRPEERRGGSKVLLGASATMGGFTSLLEAWHDDEALSEDEWRELRSLAETQKALVSSAPEGAVYGNIAWLQRAYLHSSVLPDNLLLRLGHDGDRRDTWIDLLTTPADGGLVATLGLDYEWRQGLKLRTGMRWFGGPVDSAYGQMSQNAVVFLELNGDITW